MSEQKRKFWLCVVFMALGISVGMLIGGCVPKKKGPSRLAAGIAAGDNGQNQGWFSYVMDTGDPIESEGVGMETAKTRNAYSKPDGRGGYMMVPVEPSDVQDMACSGVTGFGGQMTITGKRDNWTDWQGYWIYQRSDVYHPQRLCSGAQLNYKTATPPSTELAYSYGKAKIAKATKPPKSRLTFKEKNAVNNPTEDPPKSGIEIACTDLLQQQGNGGEGFPKELNNGFMAGNLTKPSQYLRYSSPYMFSFIFKTATPEDLVSVSIPVKINTDAYTQGIYCDVTVIASNASKTTHVARTDYFLPVLSDISLPSEMPVYERWTGFSEPNIWDTGQYVRSVREDWLDVVDPNLYSDPNTCPDPNVLFNPSDPNFYNFTSRLDTSAENFDDILIPERIQNIKVVPIGAEDFLYVEIDWSNPRLIMLIAENWLTTRKLYDFDNNGVVNFGDWPE